MYMAVQNKIKDHDAISIRPYAICQRAAGLYIASIFLRRVLPTPLPRPTLCADPVSRGSVHGPCLVFRDRGYTFVLRLKHPILDLFLVCGRGLARGV